jgi:formimidoylglutamate deiminase
MIAYRPDAVLVDGEFRTDTAVCIRDDGAFGGVSIGGEQYELVERPGTVWMPGFVNSHSHVFQRVMRGRSERRTTGASFWSWRESMYRVVQAIDPDGMETIANYTYREMLSVGYTSVCEFHYLHHGADGTPYADENEMAKRVIAAAADAGIAMRLQRVVYLSGDHNAQRRFRDPDLDTAIRRTERLANDVSVPVGIAPHSIRACTPDVIAAASDWARDSGAECHIHIAEQPKEIQFSESTYGQRPLMALRAALGPHVVGVHMTHLSDDEIQLAGAASMTACICPTTEGSLGDGLPRLRDLLDAGTQLAIGSDSHVVIDPFTEIRMLEFNERNRALSRRMLDPGAVLNACTEDLEPGRHTGWLELNTQHPALVGVPYDELVSAVVLAGRPECIVGTWMGNTFIPRQVPNPNRYLDVLQRVV